MKKGIRYEFCVPARNCGKTDKFTKLYNLIKEKRDNAQKDIEVEPNLIEYNKLRGQVSAYNDILSLMESMK